MPNPTQPPSVMPPFEPAGAERPPPRPIRCDCGRALIVKVDRERVILRCPQHGIQFRYVVRRD